MNGDEIHDLTRILVELDVPAAKLYLYSESNETFIEDEVVLMAMHKARAELTHLDPKLRLESIEWLRARMWTLRGGRPLPPPGALPD